MDCLSVGDVNEAFLAAPPLIAQQILDLTIKHPIWLRDLYQVEEWPRGAGTILEQLVFRGLMPQIERGFNNWKKIANISGCSPCEGPDCSYNWTPFGGHAFERKITQLMERDFRSPSYCVAEIQTTAHFREVFAKVVENLYRQIDFFKEMNIGQNFLTGLAKKFVVDSSGARCNTNNPYVYRPVGDVTLSALNIEMLEFFYESMRRMPDVVPYDVIDGAPIYSLLASHQLLARLYRDDTNLRQDVRFSGLANDMLMKYNFMSTIRGMFIAAPILYPRRFNVVGGVLEEVLPFVNGVPGEVGTYSYLNPAYEAATHEEVIIHGRYPFKIFTLPTETSLGENTSFGPEVSFMNSWMWANPQTECDPARRVGFFYTNAKIGLSQQFSEGIFGIAVQRPSTSLMAMYTPVPICPPTIPDCDNTVPDVTCPCPAVLSIQANPFNADNYTIFFATAITGEADDAISLQLDNGACITGTIVQVSLDGKAAEINFEYYDGLADGVCTHIVSVCCASIAGCSARVISASDCRSSVLGLVNLTLSNAIKADAINDVITAYFGDCSVQNLTVVAIDPETLTWTVQYAAGFGPTDDPTGEGEDATVLNADMICDRGGISRVCVPTATDASCPACGTTITACVDE